MSTTQPRPVTLDFTSGPVVAGALTVPYLGPAWGRKALQLMKEDPRIQEAVAGVTITVLTRIEGVPDGRYSYLYARFDGNGLADGRMGNEEVELELEGLPAPTFTIVGPYATFAAIQHGALSERKAVLSGRLHIKGSRLLALRYMGALETVTEVLAEIPCHP